MSVLTARMVLHADFTVGLVDDRLFASALPSASPHISDLFDPAHPLSDESGFRTDVIDLVRALNLPWVRSPGRQNRVDVSGPARIADEMTDLDGLAHWCRSGGAEVIRGIPIMDGCDETASALVDYCNGEGDGSFAYLRRRRGAMGPLGIRTWSLDAGADDPADRLSEQASRTARAMRKQDPRLTLLLALPDGWEGRAETADALSRCVDVIDFVSLKTGLSDEGGESDILVGERLTRSIDEACRTLDRALSRAGTRRPVHLAVESCQTSRSGGPSVCRRPVMRIGLGINAVLRRADRVRFACASDLITMLKPLLGAAARRAPVGSPLLYTSIYGRGMSLMPAVDGPRMATAAEGDVPCIDVSSVTARDRSSVTLFVVNRHPDQRCRATLALRGFGSMVVSDTIVLREGRGSRAAVNQMVVDPGGADGPAVSLEPQSFNVIRLVRAAA